ncbi:MAG: glycoside hydrolase family 1 protein [Eubacterium sp.]|nr:glycoside hydrolase family 1 protein [Eubacterium sp.]MDD7209053.1 glycoside hydrolase family 1 protein [Lachnospiraceae bacterium]
MRKLPDNFFFGAAFSGPQTEGAYKLDGKLENIWDTWSDQDIGAFYNKVGSYVGNDFYHRYEEDILLLKSLGLTSFRTSIQWSRLLDQDGKINPQGAAFYHKMLAFAKEQGMDVFMNLYHFDMPTYLFRRGGWESREVVEAYAHYAHEAFKEFGSEVKYWFTFNEPIVEPEQRYRDGVWYPFVKDIKRSVVTQYHIALAHSLAVGEFRKLQNEGVIAPDVKIGLINCFAPPYTKENPSPEDLEAVRMEDGLHNRWWLDLVTKGCLPQDVLDTLAKKGAPAPIRPGDEGILAQGKVDWLGFNYYQPKRVQAPKKTVDENGNPIFSDPYIWPERKINKSRGWEIYPKGIYDFGIKLKEDYPDLTFFISENGMGVENEDAFRDENGVIQDDYRIEFVRDHLNWVAKAIDEGAKCVGYHYWAVIDNWSWSNAFKNRYGFIEVRLQDGYNRRLKKSAEWLKKVATTKEIV